MWLFLLFCTIGSTLVAQSPASGSTPEDSVRAVELSRAQALLKADTADRDGRWQAVAMQQTPLQ